MQLKVAFLDCKAHGDCTVITFDEGDRKACIVIDGGEKTDSAKALRKYLIGEGIEAIDLMIGTHIDQDHIYGLYFFVRDEYDKMEAGKDHIMVREFWGPQPSDSLTVPQGPMRYGDIKHLDSAEDWKKYVIQSVGQNDDLYTELLNMGTIIKHPALDNIPDNPFNNVKIEILGPDTQIPANTIKKSLEGRTSRASKKIKIDSFEKLKLALSENRKALAIAAKRNANNQSIVFRFTPKIGNAEAKKWSFLFTGDAEEEAWDEMVNNPDTKNKLKARVLKIPHHGSALNGITEAGAKKVNPDYSVNLVGQKHGLPDAEILSLIHNLPSEIYCNQKNVHAHDHGDCYNISASKCPAHDDPQTVCFTLETDDGDMTITPDNRACKYNWPVV